jgi:O-antigen/teichoic acid export membrane protein
MAHLATRGGNTTLPGSAGVLAAGTSVANALAYVLTVVAARRLEPHEFGGFSALLALIIVGNVAALAVQATTARAAAINRPVAPTVGSGLLTAGFVTAVLSLASPVIQSMLRLPTPVPVVAAAVAIGALAATAPALGYAQGREQFSLLAAVVSIQAALRTGGGLVGLAVTANAASALVGMAVGFLLAGLVAWLTARPPVTTPTGPALRATLSSGALLMSFVILTNVDVILARHVLPTDLSGLYAAGSIFTKIVFWLPQFVPMLAFPALARQARHEQAMILAALTVGSCAVATTGLFWAFSDTAVRLVAGSSYGSLAGWVVGFSGLGALYALAHLLVYAHLARNDSWTTAVVWAVLISYVMVVEIIAHDLAGVLIPGLVAAGLVVCWGLAREWQLRRHP